MVAVPRNKPGRKTYASRSAPAWPECAGNAEPARARQARRKPYNLLKAAMRESGRCALAKWAWKSKQYAVQVRASDDGWRCS
jgi:hypothetical protein